MRVFISWSGERSRRVAELLDDWLQCVIQAADPWMSSKDIDRGALWFTEISDQLANTSIGIICLTKENKLKPWILFESGALAKGISSSRVCTFLIDLKPTDIENPLAQFNHTKPDKGGLWELVRTINLSLKEKALKESTLEKVFDTYWKQFEDKFKNIIKETPETEVEEIRSENDILLEVLSSVRMLDRKIRRIENEDNYKNEREFLNINTNRNISKNLEFAIRDFVKKGMPGEIIEDLLSKEYNVSPIMVKNLIEMYQSKYNDIKKE
jgi:hypothetical protein